MVALASLRSRGYEFFYRMHQALAIGGLICSIFHLNGIGFKQPLWISLALWAADWIIRVVRILLFNVNVVLPPIPGSQRMSFATMRVYPNQLIRVSVTTPVRWVCKPGQYVFLHTNRWTFIGGHPFSVLGPTEGGNGLELVIKAREGMTRRLYAALDDRSCAPEYPVTIPVYVEGPYGHAAPVESYDEGLFFAGGIGITGVLGYVERMLESSRSATLPKTIRLFWSVRSRNDIDPVAHRLARLVLEEGVHVRIFRRQPAATLPADFDLGTISNETTEYAANLGVDLGPYDHDIEEDYAGEKAGDEMLVAIDLSDEPVGDGPRRPMTQQRASRDARDSLCNNRFRYGPRQSPRQSQQQSLAAPWPGHRAANHRRSVSVQTILDFVKSGDPRSSDSDSFDYGRDEFLRRGPVEETANASPRKPRERTASFLDAGFRDAVSERPLVLNPFDDDVYPLADIVDSRIVATPTQAAPVYDLIEPASMDVTLLVNSHLKNSDGSVCIVGCGPDRMMDTLCWSCTEFVDLAKNGRVDYYEEAFRW